MAQVQVNGVTIEYEIHGTGKPMLFIMGLGGQLVAWPSEFVQLFVDRGFQVIRFDNRDIGLSSKTAASPPSPGRIMRSFLTRRPLKNASYTVAEMADDAAGLLGALDIDACDVVGVSMGGMIAQELTIRHAERVLSLCSIMSNTGDRKNGGIAPALLPKVARQKPATRDTALDVAVETIRMISGPHFELEASRAMAGEAIERDFSADGLAHQTAAIAASRNRTKLLGDVTVPTLVVHGLLDQLVQPSGGVATAKAVPQSRLLNFPDMAHDLPRPRWHELCAEIARNTERAVDPAVA